MIAPKNSLTLLIFNATNQIPIQHNSITILQMYVKLLNLTLENLVVELICLHLNKLLMDFSSLLDFLNLFWDQ